jgi:hypothetical protein
MAEINFERIFEYWFEYFVELNHLKRLFNKINLKEGKTNNNNNKKERTKMSSRIFKKNI